MIMNEVQSNLNSLNTDGLFTMANSNLILNPHEILPIAQENEYLGNFLVNHKIVCCVFLSELPH